MSVEISDGLLVMLLFSLSSQKIIFLQIVIPLTLLQLVEAFNANSLFSYITYMVVDFVPSIHSTDQAGAWSGFLGSAFYFGQFLSSFAWGVLSDRYGKRKILILGTLGTLVTVLAFGFSRNIYYALCVRFLGGLLNGNIGVAKALLGQIATKETQPKLFGMFGIAWGAGAIIAGAYGGLLARIAVKMPETFGGTIFDTFPYLLPNLVTVFTAVIALICGILFLFDPPVTAPPRKRNFGAVLRNPGAMLTTISYGLLGNVVSLCPQMVASVVKQNPFVHHFHQGDRTQCSTSSCHYGSPVRSLSAGSGLERL